MAYPDVREMRVYLPTHPDTREIRNLVERVFPGCLMIEVLSDAELPTLEYKSVRCEGLTAIKEYCASIHSA